MNEQSAVTHLHLGACLLLLFGCSSGSGTSTSTDPVGGESATGGAAASGGTGSDGGADAAGGSGSGGVSATGGAEAAGSSGSGGVSATGGAEASGGSGSGGVVAAGGADAAGGRSGTGGVPATGGTNAAGGRSGTGGVPATGGAEAAGGSGSGGVVAAGGTNAAGGSGSGGVVAAGGTVGSGGGGTVETTDAPGTDISFAPSDAMLLNPERGFYTTADLAEERDFARVRRDDKTLLYGAVHLDAYLGADHAQDLPEQVLDDTDAGFAAVREAGLKVIVRFQYDDGEGYDSGTGANDATKEWMLRHIQQLAPILTKNEDVLFVYQAGFIGAWGEWHTSQNFRDGTADADIRKEIVEAMLAGSPASRTVGLRYPAYKRMFYGTLPISDTQSFTDTSVARVGHFNDCFLSGTDDVGTYQYEPMATLKDYLALDTQYVPIGGETCATDARNECPIATEEMARFHFTYINEDYNRAVISRWTEGGCRGDIDRKLGYRIALTSGNLPTEVKPGGSFALNLSLTNEGWATLMTPRPVIVVLQSATGERLEATLPLDPRAWQPGPHEIRARLRVPADLATGTYRLSLWLPDAAPSLRERPEYAVQLANQGVWDQTYGDNTLAELALTTDADGTADPEATTFSVIP